MRSKCNKCGNVEKVHFKAKNRFRICFKCGGRLTIRFTNAGEYYLYKKRKQKGSGFIHNQIP